MIDKVCQRSSHVRQERAMLNGVPKKTGSFTAHYDLERTTTYRSMLFGSNGLNGFSYIVSYFSVNIAP